MITIEEKLKLFAKIVYDKVEKENFKITNEFNLEYGNLIEQKKQEFIKESEDKLLLANKNAMREGQMKVSKAKAEGKKLLVEKRKELYEDALLGLISYAKEFTSMQEYRELFLKDFKNALSELRHASKLDIYLSESDASQFKDDILKDIGEKNFEIHGDNSIVGGFIILDKEKNIRIDMTLSSRIQNAKEFIGEKLFEIFE